MHVWGRIRIGAGEHGVRELEIQNDEDRLLRLRAFGRTPSTPDPA